MSTLNRRDFLGLCAAGAAAPFLQSCSPSGRESAGIARPNIIIMMADDMGYSDIGCYGGEINTPHLDRLAGGGVRFTQFSNTARCCPTRASLLTGLYPHQAGVGHMMSDYGLPGYRGDLNQNCVTIAEALKPAGYTTLMSGKWHVTPAEKSSPENWPRQRGFDRFFGTIHGAGSFYDPVTLTRENEPADPGPDFYYTDAISDQAVDYIEEYGGADNPFFMYVSYTSPHWPLHAPEEAVAKYKGRYAMGWDQLRAERYKRMIEMGLIDERWPLTPRDPRVPPWQEAEHKEWEQRRMEVYAAQVEIMDQGVGRIRAKLEEKELLGNTLILFLADNGGCAEELDPSWKGLHIPATTYDGRPVVTDNTPEMMPGPEETYQSYGVPWANASNTPFRLYKHWVHEGGIATPLIAHWPERIQSQAGTMSAAPGHVIDLMATCVDAGGAEYPSSHNGNQITPLEGKSLTPAFDSGAREGHEAIYWEHEGNRAVRQGKWKLVSRWNQDDGGRWELYDLEADRTEMNNLAGSNAAQAAELEQMYEAWAERANVAPWRSWA